MASISTSNITSGFIDLATFDEIERYLYGGDTATAYFVRETRKSTWFTQVPVILSNASGQPQFGQDWSVSISRAGDYLLQTWLRVGLPQIRQNANADENQGIRWTRNLMHNLVKDCCITFNDLVAARFDSFHLDFWSAFTVPAGKQDGYNQMIGNTAALTTLQTGQAALPPSVPGDSGVTMLNLPLPFFYSRDSGVALPTAALPYNEMRINFSFRNWNELLIKENVNSASTVEYRQVCSAADLLGGSEPQLTKVQVWANYAIVSNDERKRMACAPRDILIEQVQTANRQTFSPSTVPQPRYDLRLSHAIKVLFFAVRNKTFQAEWSNYTASSPGVGKSPQGGKFTGNYAVDPILDTTLVYENTNRLGSMGSDYFSLVNPYYHAPVIPSVTGYHCYSYSLDFICLDPMGSTNYGKLTNVSILPNASQVAVAANAASGISNVATCDGCGFKQSYEFVLTAVDNNIIRVSGGALGFPVL
mgnify:CR=1 FL=1|jgi:hypothetical protein